MKKLTILVVCCACFEIPLSSSASANLVVYEPFDYTSGESVFSQTNGNGQSWLRAGVANPPDGITVASGSLSVPTELQPAVGNSGKIAGVGNGSGSSLRLGLGGALTSDTVYFSFALRIDALTGSNTTSGGFFIGLNNSTGTQATNPSVVGAKVSGRIDPNDGAKYQLGIFNNVSPTGTATTWSPSLIVGDTHFIVAAYTFNSGTGDDVSSIWIDPGSLGAGSAPAATMTATGGTDLAQVASILLRQSPAPYLTLDELRVGSTWADVTISAVPEASAGMFLLVGSVFLVGRSKAWQRLAPWMARSSKSQQS